MLSALPTIRIGNDALCRASVARATKRQKRRLVRWRPGVGDFRLVRFRVERDCLFPDAPVSVDVFRLSRFVRESDFPANQRARGV